MERVRVNRLLRRLEQKAISWKSSASSSYHLWQKAVPVATKHSSQNILVAKCTFCILWMWSVNALQGGVQACISLSPLHLPYAAAWRSVIRHMLDLNRDLEICSSGWLAASKQGQVVVAECWWSWWSTTGGGKPCPLPPYVAILPPEGHKIFGDIWDCFWWFSIGGRGDPQRVVASIAHCHLKATTSAS